MRTMKRISLIRLLALLLALPPMMVAVVPGCTQPEPDPCTVPGETIWLCRFLIQRKGCGCFEPMEEANWACAGNPGTARERAELVLNADFNTVVLSSRGCVNTGSAYPQAAEPELIVEHLSCEPAPRDDACHACAKASCCSEYDACVGNANCACLIDCLFDGRAPSVCTLPENCGPVDDTFAATAVCLDSACRAPCPTPDSLADASTSSSTDPSTSTEEASTAFKGEIP